jgi:hypothetical protein
VIHCASYFKGVVRDIWKRRERTVGVNNTSWEDFIPSAGETFPNASKGGAPGHQGIKLCTFAYKFVSSLHYFNASVPNASLQLRASMHYGQF